MNPSHAGVQTPLSDAQVIEAVQQLAQVWMNAVPSVRLVYDGQTTDQAVNFNDIIGFSALGPGSIVDIPKSVSSDGRTITGFNVQLATQVPWDWHPCDGANTPCDPYPGTAVDLGEAMSHAWGHVLGHQDTGAAQDRLLTDYGGITAGPDCGGTAGPECRFAVTLGLGDVLGARHLYPTSAPMPTLYYDQ